MIPGVNYTWGTMDQPWGQISFTYSDLWLLQEVKEIVVSGGNHRRKGRSLDPKEKEKIFKKIGEEKTKKFIKLICFVEGQEYRESKQIKDLDISVAKINSYMTEISNRISVSM